MKKFAGSLLLFFLIQAGVFGLLLHRFDTARSDHYLASTNDKHRRLNETPPPRILLVGGSNVALGFHSGLIESELERPVVNMALVAGVGLNFMLNEIESSVGQGDLVVLSIEYDLFGDKYIRSRLRQVIVRRPASVRYLNVKQFGRILSERGLALLAEIVRRSIESSTFLLAEDNETDPMFERSDFNQWGDFIGHYDRPSAMISSPPGSVAQKIQKSWLPTERIRKRLRAFVNHCQSRGARVVYSCPPVPGENLEAALLTIRPILEELEEVPGLTVIDQPEDQTYPINQFYDSTYHLTAEGSLERSRRLIRALRRYLSTPGK